MLCTSRWRRRQSPWKVEDWEDWRKWQSWDNCGKETGWEGKRVPKECCYQLKLLCSLSFFLSRSPVCWSVPSNILPMDSTSLAFRCILAQWVIRVLGFPYLLVLSTLFRQAFPTTGPSQLTWWTPTATSWARSPCQGPPSPPSLHTAGTSLARLISQCTRGWESTMQGTRRLWTRIRLRTVQWIHVAGWVQVLLSVGPLRLAAPGLLLLHSPRPLQAGRGGKGERSRFSVFLKVAAIISGLHEPSALLHEEERVDRTIALAKFFNSTLNTHNYWAIRMLLCELLFFLNVVFNIFLIDAFLGGEFSTFGLEVVNFVAQDPQYRMDPMSR